MGSALNGLSTRLMAPRNDRVVPYRARTGSVLDGLSVGRAQYWTGSVLDGLSTERAQYWTGSVLDGLSTGRAQYRMGVNTPECGYYTYRLRDEVDPLLNGSSTEWETWHTVHCRTTCTTLC